MDNEGLLENGDGVAVMLGEPEFGPPACPAVPVGCPSTLPLIKSCGENSGAYGLDCSNCCSWGCCTFEGGVGATNSLFGLLSCSGSRLTPFECRLFDRTGRVVLLLVVLVVCGFLLRLLAL